MAKLALQDRDKRLAEAYDLIERDLILLGATAVEDRWSISFKRFVGHLDFKKKWQYSLYLCLITTLYITL